MILDKQLVLSDAQAITGSTNSTDYVDSLAAGTGYNSEVYVQFLVDTVFGGTAGSTVALAIQTAQDSAFATLVQNIVVATPTIAALVAGYNVSMKIPPVAGRYIRAYYTVTGTVASGNIDARLALDIDITMDRKL